MKRGHFCFKKSERVVSQKLIDDLFGNTGSHSMVAFPIRAVFKLHEAETDAETEPQILISVPKKRFHHAVDRNRVKRQVREAYRHQKELLKTHIPTERQLTIAFIWLSDQLQPSALVDARIKSLLERIARKI